MESVRFRINGYGKRIYYSTICHDITVSEKPIEFFQERYNKKYLFGSNVVYEIFFGIEAIEGCDN